MENVRENTIELKNVSVEFPGVKALNHACLKLQAGNVRAVVGANGAGKSTMMKVLSGVNSNYTGQVCFNDETVEIRSTDDAKQLGIEIVYQEVDTALIPTLSVGENIMIEHFVYGLKKRSFVDWKYIFKTSDMLLKELNLQLDSRTLVSNLSLAQKQMVLIARAIHCKCRFLILDEPTAPLSDAETQKLFEIVRQLKSEGVGIIFISHRLQEIFEICDDITVMRDGCIIESFPITKDVTIDHIVSLMLGDARIDTLDKSNRQIGEVALSVEHFSDRKHRIHDIDFNIRSGEIVGVAGLVGAGKTEFCKALFGVYGKTYGTMKIKGKVVSVNNPAQAVRSGLAFIPEERRKEGVVVGEPIYSNLSLATLSNLTGIFSFIKKKKELETARVKICELHIKAPSEKQRVALLSGGNQQKVTIGKWLDSSADIYIFDEPTKGIDVGAKNEVYKLIVKLAREGKAIIYATSEQSEIMTITDRTYILFDGAIKKEVVTSETNEEELLFYSTGGKKE